MSSDEEKDSYVSQFKNDQEMLKKVSAVRNRLQSFKNGQIAPPPTPALVYSRNSISFRKNSAPTAPPATCLSKHNTFASNCNAPEPPVLRAPKLPTKVSPVKERPVLPESSPTSPLSVTNSPRNSNFLLTSLPMAGASTKSVQNLASTQPEVEQPSSSSSSSNSICVGDSISLNSSSNEVEVPVSQDVPNRMYRLQRAAEEFLSTEDKYVAELDCLCKLDENLRANGYDFSIFKDLPCLLKFHEVLLEDIRKVFTEERYTQMYQPFLAKSCAYLKMYKDLSHRMTQALTPYFTKKASDLRLTKIITDTLDTETRYKDGKDDLTLLKDVPIRISRYLLLLDNLMKFIPKETEDYTLAAEARDRVKEIVWATNEHMSTMSKQETKLHMMSIIGPVSKSPCPWASFIKAGSARKLSKRSEGRKEEYREIFLFSDMFYVKAGAVLKLELSVISIAVEPVELYSEKARMLPFRFRVRGKEGFIELVFDKEEEMESWKTELIKAVADCKKKTNSDTVVETSAHAWVKDEAVSMCTECRKPFTLLFRRHHCRRCGKIICRFCSRFKDNNSSNRDNRMCPPCLGDSKASLATLRATVPQVRLNRNSSLPDIVKPLEEETSKSSFSLPVKVYYEKFDQNEWIKEGKFFCRVDPYGNLHLYKKPGDPRPKCTVVCLSHTVIDAPEGFRGSSRETDSILIQHPSQPLEHLLRIPDLKQKEYVFRLLKERVCPFQSFK